MLLFQRRNVPNLLAQFLSIQQASHDLTAVRFGQLVWKRDFAWHGDGLLGLIAKRIDSRYESGERSGAWLKMRVNRGQEFVIGGYTPTLKNFDALILGYYEGERLIYGPYP